jgi:hypothetical protein
MFGWRNQVRSLDECRKDLRRRGGMVDSVAVISAKRKFVKNLHTDPNGTYLAGLMDVFFDQSFAHIRKRSKIADEVADVLFPFVQSRWSGSQTVA